MTKLSGGAILRHIILMIGLLGLAGCATTNAQNHKSQPVLTKPGTPSVTKTENPTAPDTNRNPPVLPPSPISKPKLKPKLKPKSKSKSKPKSKPVNIPVTPQPYDSGYRALKFWQGADPRPALTAFQKTCEAWKTRDPETWLMASRPDFGRLNDWMPACRAARQMTKPSQMDAIHFFQTHFEPLAVSQKPKTGLLTGYYAPEIEVRMRADAEFSAPLLTPPKTTAIQTLPRKDLSAKSSKVLAFGRPTEVFFLQIQGSGRIKFKDGTRAMAAFAGHNGHTYKSIGRVLIARGALEKDAVSKQAIEDWMQDAGPEDAQKLINTNPRYIYFKREPIQDGVGPKGAAGIPLTAMGSLAIDPRHLPYGLPIWLQTKLPIKGGDFDGQPSGFLVVTQDTGSAIKGHQRGDLYFGMGHLAGAKAGVMKHKAVWTLFLPTALSIRAQELSKNTLPSS